MKAQAMDISTWVVSKPQVDTCIVTLKASLRVPLWQLTKAFSLEVSCKICSLIPMPANINSSLEDYSKRNRTHKKDGTKRQKKKPQVKNETNKNDHFLVCYDSGAHRSCFLIYSILIL